MNFTLEQNHTVKHSPHEFKLQQTTGFSDNQKGKMCLKKKKDENYGIQGFLSQKEVILPRDVFIGFDHNLYVHNMNQQ